jgi:peptidoglycan/LPS O-acetylase OafA/YrhL
MTAQAERHGKIADIELLRAVAIIFVLLQHSRTNLFTWLPLTGTHLYFYFGFWNGVDLFFAISGFVIARSLLPTLQPTGETTTFFRTALAFWIRRAWRLLPSAWLWLAIILIGSVFFNRSGVFMSFHSNFEATVAALLDVANFRQIMIFGRFEPGASFPYWSLSLEEQFYILLPFAVFFAGPRLPYVLGAGILLQFFVTRTGADSGIWGLWLNQLRSDAIMFGVLIAIWSTHPSYRLFEPAGLRTRRLTGFAVFAFFVFSLAAVGAPALHIVPFQVGMVALISAVLVLLASYDRDYLCPPGAFKSAMLWVGSRSYALYLVHIPIFFLTREFWFRIEPPGTVFDGTFTVRFALTAAALLMPLAELNYRLVEVPLRRRGAAIALRIASKAPA